MSKAPYLIKWDSKGVDSLENCEKLCNQTCTVFMYSGRVAKIVQLI